MKVGFTLSPGGLLLPYHLGALDALRYNGFLTDSTPIGGASAGSIAAATHACSLDHKFILDQTIDLSDKCHELGGARGRLLPLLRDKLTKFIDQERFEAFQSREGECVISYRQLFPFNRAIHAKEFQSSEELIDSVCYSCMFPFFSTNWPVAFDTSEFVPRLFVDGFFAVPRDRFGCPDFDVAGVDVDRSVAISVFPREFIGLNATRSADCISPSIAEDGSSQMERLFHLALEASSARELTSLFDSGWEDAEEWCRRQSQDVKEDATTNPQPAFGLN